MSPSLLRPARGAAALFFLSSVASAQIDWLTFHQDNSHLVASSQLGTGDTQEKDYAWADLDKDGWTDLVVVRKQPFTTSGRHENVLFMNEAGVLVDRTALYASASTVAGDNGFLTPTNDRDVVIVDLDLDGWLDVVTATTISPGQPKSISHPRVYMNQGEDSGGTWLGLVYEEARFPDFGTFPNFCAVASGDVTGDGYPDLYFAHYHQSADVDLDDRLLVNDGSGYFIDDGSSRMSSSMLASSFGTAAAIADMNNDGTADIIKDTALGSTGASGPRITLSYNNPSNEGYFSILQTPYSGAPYHVNTGDLNRDGLLDLVISDDSSDRYLLNQGNDALGRVLWSSAYTYPSGDDGFGSNNMVVDLDGDLWSDVLIADVDVDISGCSRRLHIYHNQGGTIGGFVTLSEESGSGWRGATGLTSGSLQGTHDVAVFDLDNDGDMDMVLGRCTGTSVWINDQTLDCNGNGIGDGDDISDGTSSDCNANGIPDECEADCDSDGLPDDCEVDCNSNGTPDDCESFSDCDANGVPDECQPDCDSDGTPDACETDCNSNGTPDDCESFSDCNANSIPDECEADCDSDGTPDDCEADCNANGTPDDCESFTDCDSNGVPDECQDDCDGDGTPDACETDCNSNGTPDDCESFDDCDSNGVPDECDPDTDGDGIPDACEIGVNFCGPAVTNSAGLSATLEASGSNVVADNDLTLHAGQMPPFKFGYFLASQTQAFIANPGGSQGNLCLGGQIARYAKDVKSSGVSGEFSLQVDLDKIPPPINAPVLPGETWNWQVWYRDNNPGQTSNFTDGISIVFV